MTKSSKVFESAKARLVAACCCAVIAAASYFFFGYSSLVCLGWISALALSASAFFISDSPQARTTLLCGKDIFLCLSIVMIFTPLYLFGLHEIPNQVNADETVVIDHIKRVMNNPTANIFGFSWLGQPAMPYILFGHAAQLMGAVNLEHVRFAHSIWALIALPSCYLFYRSLGMAYSISLACALWIGVNHAFIGLSRLAMQDINYLVYEGLGLTCLIIALRQQSKFWAFAAGCVSGLAFYSYYPARVVLILCATVVFVHAVSRLMELLRKSAAQVEFKSFASPYAKIATSYAVGAAMALWPLPIAVYQDPLSFDAALKYLKQMCLLFPEGRFEQALVAQSQGSEVLGILLNVRNGITVFNNNFGDIGGFYCNPGTGFVDPVSGILIWIGLISLLVSKQSLARLVMPTCLLSLMLLFTFVVNRCPCYSRLVVILPFAAFFAVWGALSMSRTLSHLGRSLSRNSAMVQTGLSLGTLALIAVINLNDFRTYVNRGFKCCDDDYVILGYTGRFAEKHHRLINHTFILVEDEENRYYYWRNPDDYRWIQSFICGSQRLIKMTPPQLYQSELSAPCTLFMTKKLWDANKARLAAKFPELKVEPISPDRFRVAVEVR